MEYVKSNKEFLSLRSVFKSQNIIMFFGITLDNKNNW